MANIVNSEEIKSLCKDAESFRILEKYVQSIIQLKETAESHLRLLESAIKGDYDSILITDLELEFPGPRIVYVNEGFTKMTGYSREDVIGKTPRILQGPKTDRTTLSRLKKCLKDGKTFFGQAVNYRKDGSEFINQWDIHPIHNERGEVTHWVSYQHDITARKKAELTFLEQDVEFDDLYEFSKRILLDVNRTGSVRMANKSFRELLGYNDIDILKTSVFDLVPKRHRTRVIERFDLLWEEATFRETKSRLVFETKDGGWLQLEIEPKILNLSDEEVLRLSITNLSLQKKVLRTLNRRNRQFDSIFERWS